jgi:hypothetical protein
MEKEKFITFLKLFDLPSLPDGVAPGGLNCMAMSVVPVENQTPESENDHENQNKTDKS